MTLLAPEPNRQRLVPTFGLTDRLRKARETSGMDQGEFADALGMTRQSIGNYESGRRKPAKPYLIAWAEVSGVSLEWLETGKAPAVNDGSHAVRPKGFEPLTFWSVVCEGLGLADQLTEVFEARQVWPDSENVYTLTSI